MCGKVIFTDGHTEDILTFVKYDQDHITFVTESGTYYFVGELRYVDIPYEISTTGMFMYTAYEFRKEVDGKALITFDIHHIELDERKIGRE